MEDQNLADMSKAIELAKQFELAAAAGRSGAFPETAMLAACLLLASKFDGIKDSLDTIVDALRDLAEGEQNDGVYSIEDLQVEPLLPFDSVDRTSEIHRNPADEVYEDLDLQLQQEYREDPPVDSLPTDPTGHEGKPAKWELLDETGKIQLEPESDEKPKRKYERKGFGG